MLRPLVWMLFGEEDVSACFGFTYEGLKPAPKYLFPGLPVLVP